MGLRENLQQKLKQVLFANIFFSYLLQEQSVVCSRSQSESGDVLNQDEGFICDLFYKFSLIAKTLPKLS